MADVTVLAAVRGSVETQVVLALGTPGSGTTVTRRCGDVVELLAAADAGAGSVAVVSGDLPGLDRETVARLHTAGVRVVAFADGAEERLRALGVDAVIDGALATTGNDVLVTTVRDAASGPSGPGRPDLPADPPPDGPLRPPGRPGRVVTVWGPVGAPGRSTVALEVAAAFAGAGGAPGRRGRSRRTRAPQVPVTGDVLLVEADTYGAALAMRLGLLDDAPGITAACRAAGQGALDAAALSRLSPQVIPGLRVLTGPARAARWPEIATSSLEVVLDRAREVAAWTIVDTAAPIEADEVLMYDTHAPQRNAATLTALAAADDVVVVGTADPIGIQRLVRAIEDLKEAPVAVPTPFVVAVNRVRAAVVGANPRAAVRDALARYAGLDDVVIIPDDPGSLDGALLAGRSLAEHAPGSPVSTAMAGLAARLHTRGGVLIDT